MNVIFRLLVSECDCRRCVVIFNAWSCCLMGGVDRKYGETAKRVHEIDTTPFIGKKIVVLHLDAWMIQMLFMLERLSKPSKSSVVSQSQPSHVYILYQDIPGYIHPHNRCRSFRHYAWKTYDSTVVDIESRINF